MKIVHVLLLHLLLMGMIYSTTGVADVTVGEKVVVKSGRTVGNAISIGDEVHVYGTVTESAVSCFGDVIVEEGGKVKGDAVSIGGDIVVKDNGEVCKNAVTVLGRIRLSPHGRIRGDHVTVSPSFMKYALLPFSGACKLVDSLGDFISSLIRIVFIGPLGVFWGLFGAFIAAMIFIVKFIFWIGIAALVTYFFPENVSSMAYCAQEELPKAFLLGILTLFLMPMIFLFLLVSLIGIPFMPLIAVLMFCIYLFGSVGIALWAGRIIPESEGRSLMTNVLLGVLAISMVRFIPFIGFFVGILVSALAFGVVIITRFGKLQYRAVI